MIPYFNQGSRIVRSWPGSGTLDTIYETENGEQWLSTPIRPEPYVNSTSVQRVGRIIGDRIFG